MEWKQNSLLKVEGVCSRSGIFPATNPDNPDDKTPTTLTPELLRNLFSKFSKPVNFRITHSGKDTVGYLTDLGYDESDDSIRYKGFVYDPDGIQKISSAGFDKISLELGDLIGDSNNPTDATITGAVFTRKPAIPDTDVQLNYMYFSELLNEEIGDLKMTEAETKVVGDVDISGKVREETQREIARINEETKRNAEAARLAELEENFSKTKAAEEALMAENKTVSEKYKKLISAEIGKVESELKAFNFADPEEYLKSLDPETRLEALNEVKARLSKNTKITSPLDANIKSSGSRAERTKDSVVAEMGLPESYKKYLR